MAYWLDYSAAKLPGSTIKAAGYTGVIRYLDSPERLSTKHTNKSEFESHLAAGLSVMMVMQTTTTASDGGYATGQSHARRALAGAQHLGYDDGPIFFTNDRTTVPSPAAWRGYLDGAASILGRERVGAYGFRNAMDLAVGHATYFWQAGRRSDVAEHTHIWQDNNTQVTVGGITCDRNLILKDLEDDMPTVADILNAKITRQGSALGGQTTVAAVLANIDRVWETQAARDAAILAAVAANTTDPDITEARLAQLIDGAVDAHMPTADEVAAAQRVFLEELVREVVPDEQAELIVAKLGEKLRAP